MHTTNRDPRGQFAIDLRNQELEERIIGATFSGQLDESSLLSVTLASDYQLAQQIQNSQFPPKASVRWQDKGLFRGELVDTSFFGHTQVSLLYRDSLSLAKKNSQNTFMKSPSLQQVLNKICSSTKLSTRFCGDFGDILPAYNFVGQTLFDHLSTLSYMYGFYFVCRSYSQQIVFVRMGSHIKTVDMGEQDSISSIETLQSIEQTYSSVSFRYFDAQSMDSQEKQISQAELYAPVAPYKKQSAFQEKLSRSHAQGKAETHVPDRASFEGGDKLFKHQFSKRLMQQEHLRVRCHEPIGFPGDKLQMKGAPAPRVQEGNYLIQSCQISFHSAVPKMELIAIRP